MNRRAHKRSPVARLACIALAAAFISLSSAAPAQAAEPKDIIFEPSTTKIVYGENWSIKAFTNYNSCPSYGCTNGSVTVSYTGPTSGTIELGLARSVYFYSGQIEKPLLAGEYSFTAKFKRGTVTGVSPSPTKIIVSPAPLAIDLRVLPDDNNEKNAIISAELTGTFVDSIGCYECAQQRLPAGTWNISIVDSEGENVFEESIDRDDQASRAISLYWPTTPPGENFTASATFVPVDEFKSSFTITPENDVAYSSPSGSTIVDGEETVTPPVEEEIELGPTVPLWSIFAAGGLALLLLILVVVFAILAARAGRTPRPVSTTPEPEAV